MTLVGRTTNMINALRSFLLAVLATAALTSPAPAQGAVRIGVLTPLSPPGDAAAGQFIVRGAKMAVEEINGKGGVLGGRKIELIVEDESGTPEKGVGVVEETKKQFVSMNVKAELKTIIFDRAVVDLTPQILEIKNWKPDLFINVGIGTPLYLTTKQAYDVGLFPATPMLMSYDAPARPEYWNTLGE